MALLWSGRAGAENWIDLGQDKGTYGAVDLDSIKGDAQRYKATVLAVGTSPTAAFVVRIYMEFDCSALTAAMSGGARLNLADGTAEEFAQRQEPSKVEMANRVCAVPRNSAGASSVAQYVKQVEDKLKAAAK